MAAFALQRCRDDGASVSAVEALKGARGTGHAHRSLRASISKLRLLSAPLDSAGRRIKRTTYAGRVRTRLLHLLVREKNTSRNDRLFSRRRTYPRRQLQPRRVDLTVRSLLHKRRPPKKMEKPPFLHRPSLRHRHSMQDCSSSSMRSLRRLDRHSIGGASSSLHNSLLEHLQVQFVKALVPANKLHRPRYVMKVTNLALNRSWEMVRPYKDFYDMKEDLLKAIDHGHLCQSNCPWIYMYVTHHFPRRHFFRSRQASVVSGRLTDLGAFMSTLLRMMKENRSLECSVSAEAVPKIIYDFLYEGMVFDRSDFANTILESRVSLGSARDLRSVSLPPGEECTICRRALKHSDSSLSLTRSSDPTYSSSGSLSDDAGSDTDIPMIPLVEQQSLTTLDCGHRFHDECILKKLNQSLECPLCLAEMEAETDANTA